MQQKRNIRLLISLCVLIVITTVVLFLFNREEAVVDKTVFRVEDLKTIDKVVLEHDSAKQSLRLTAFVGK
jgi:dihydroorotase